MTQRTFTSETPFNPPSYCTSNIAKHPNFASSSLQFHASGTPSAKPTSASGSSSDTADDDDDDSSDSVGFRFRLPWLRDLIGFFLMAAGWPFGSVHYYRNITSAIRSDNVNGMSPCMSPTSAFIAPFAAGSAQRSFTLK